MKVITNWNYSTNVGTVVNSDWKEHVEIKVDDTGDVESVQPYEWTNKKISFTLPKLRLPYEWKDFGTCRIRVVIKPERVMRAGSVLDRKRILNPIPPPFFLAKACSLC